MKERNKKNAVLTVQEKESLVQKAKQAMEFSYSPYSGFRVGAALYGKNGEVYTGCNIENAAFSPTICAERTAVAKAVSQGCKQFLAIAVAGSGSGFISPCGVCRQVLAEFADPAEFIILQSDEAGAYKEYTLDELLPDSFGGGAFLIKKYQEEKKCQQ